MTLCRRMLLPVAAALFASAPALAQSAPPDSLPAPAEAPAWVDSAGHEPEILPAPLELRGERESDWMRAPFGDVLLTHPDPWRERRPRHDMAPGVAVDYNHVDLLRPSLHFEAQEPSTLAPRLGARIEFATGRQRLLYGVQLEQPLLRPARFVFGLNMVRRTDHHELQQVEDLENSLALLLAREDDRDYFEREGEGAYLSWRVPDFSTVSVHARRDVYRSLDMSSDVRSWFKLTRPLRPNPAIDDGETHSVLLRLERLARRNRGTRSGLYHWIEVERSGGGLGGDFTYLRALADVRSVLRLSPATTLSLRGVGGTTPDGALPRQKVFTTGGLDGLRAHPFGSFRGDQLALGQAEYTFGLWRLRGRGFESGLHAIAFLDTGTAWFGDSSRWDVERQHFALDGGIGLSASEDNLRVYVARDLRANGRVDPVVSLRLQRPF